MCASLYPPKKKSLICKLNGHTLGSGGSTILHMGLADPVPSDKDPEVMVYKNCEWVCGRCGHTEFVRYGDKPKSFGPHVIIRSPIKVRLS